MNISVFHLLEHTGGTLLSGDGETILRGFSVLGEAGPSDLCFFHDPRYREGFLSTRAGAVLVPRTWSDELPAAGGCLIGVPDPSLAFERAVERWGVQPEVFVPGAHPSAVISPSAVFDPAGVSIGPHAVIGAGVTLGAGTVIGAGCFLGTGVSLGADCVLHAGVTVQAGCQLGDRVILHPGVVIGADGFGYQFAGGVHRKIRQAGMVRLDDDVEIGANSTVDRARFGRTWIKKGTKIDNLVQIGHNSVIGCHCVIAAGTAVAGSAVLEDRVTVAGQCGIAGHLRVGANSVLAARAGVTRHLPANGVYMGFPARPAHEERRRMAAGQRVVSLLQRVKELEGRLEKLEAGGNSGQASA